MDIGPLLKSQFLPILEAVLYRRDLNSNSSLSYHNHVLQGCFLRYIVHPLKHNEVPAYRYGLVAGMRKGVMREMKLSPSSEISVVKLLTSESTESRTALNVTGIDAVTSSRVTWQLVMPSHETENEWKKALDAAKWSKENLESCWESEFELMRDVTWKLSQGVPIKSRLHKFTVYRNCFLGVVGVRFLMHALSLSSANAMILGNKLLSAGLIEHVTHEHVFCDGRRFYRILIDSSPPNSMNRVGGDVDEDVSGQLRVSSRGDETQEDSGAYLMQLVSKYKKKYKRAQKDLSKLNLEAAELSRMRNLGGTMLQHHLFICQMLLCTGAVAFGTGYAVVAMGCVGLVCAMALYYDVCVIYNYGLSSVPKPSSAAPSCASDAGESEAGSDDGSSVMLGAQSSDTEDNDYESDHDGDELDFADETEYQTDAGGQYPFDSSASPCVTPPKGGGAVSAGLNIMRRVMNRPPQQTTSTGGGLGAQGGIRGLFSGSGRARANSAGGALHGDDSPPPSQSLRKRVGSFIHYSSKQ